MSNQTQTEQQVDFLSRILQTINNVEERCHEFLYRAWRSLRIRLGGRLRDIWDYLTPNAPPPERSEEERIEAGIFAIYSVLGTDDPVENFRKMAPNERRAAIIMIEEVLSRNLDLPSCDIRFLFESPPNFNGAYADDKNCIYINSDHLEEQPLSSELAIQILDTIMHEKYHHFQFTAMMQPGKYKVNKKTAKLWRFNARNYINSEENPIGYYMQSLETAARLYATRILCNL